MWDNFDVSRPPPFFPVTVLRPRVLSPKNECLAIKLASFLACLVFLYFWWLGLLRITSGGMRALKPSLTHFLTFASQFEEICAGVTDDGGTCTTPPKLEAEAKLASLKQSTKCHLQLV